MQLWTKEGYRNLWCQQCKKQARCNHWICSHDKPWTECPTHRIDPDQHRTTKIAPKIQGHTAANLLLPFQRPEPEPRKFKHARLWNSQAGTHKRKSVVQSCHPAFYRTDLSRCPNLRARLARNGQVCTELMSDPTTESSFSVLHGSDANSIQPTTGASSVASGPCGTVLPLREGSVRREGKCTGPSVRGESDQRDSQAEESVS